MQHKNIILVEAEAEAFTSIDLDTNKERPKMNAMQNCVRTCKMSISNLFEYIQQKKTIAIN